MAALIPILLGVTFLTFAMMRLAEEDAVDVFYEQAGVVAEDIKAAKRAELGLDQPFLVQYGRWLAAMLQGDMGRSFISGRPALGLVADKLPATAVLMVASLALTLLVAVPLGVLAALRRGTWVDAVIRGLTFAGNSLPNFFTALLLIYFLALQLGLLPVMSGAGDGRGVILPALTLAISMGAKYTRQVRALFLEELEKPYVMGAASRGVPQRVILFGSILPSVAVPLIILLALSIGSLLGGAAIVETIFLWDGVGKLAIDAIRMKDYPVVQAYVVWMAMIYAAVNLLADIVCRGMDPRLRSEEMEAGK